MPNGTMPKERIPNEKELILRLTKRIEERQYDIVAQKSLIEEAIDKNLTIKRKNRLLDLYIENELDHMLIERLSNKNLGGK